MTVRKSNKNSGSEDRLGELHGLITEVFVHKTRSVMNLLEKGADADMVVNMKDLATAAKWVLENGIGASLADTESESELSKNLDRIKTAQRERLKLVGNGLPLSDEEEY